MIDPVVRQGVICSGHQVASGLAVDRADRPSPFSAGTLALQAAHFRARGFDLAERVPNLFWGTVNVGLKERLVLRSADVTLAHVDWSADQPHRIAPETFSFVRCRLIYEGGDFPGLIYYPHPETKPDVHRHDPTVLEIITTAIPALRTGAPAAVACRADAFAAVG